MDEEKNGVKQTSKSRLLENHLLCARKFENGTPSKKSTLDSLISVAPQIKVAPGKFGKNNKRSHSNKRSPWKI